MVIMRRAGLPITFLAAVLLFVSFAPLSASAAEYDFKVEREEATVYIRTDGMARIDYHFEFWNYGTGFDVVDIGMPNSDYSLSTTSARVRVYDGQGTQMKDDRNPIVKSSEFVDPGVEVHVNAHANKRIVLDLSIICDRMVWESPKNKSMASVEFRPTWYSSEYQQGAVGFLKVTLVLPKRVPSLNNTAWYNREWDYQNLTDEGWALTWESTDASPSGISRGSYDVGVAFPRQYVDKVYKETFLSTLAEFFASLCSLS